MCVYKTPRQSDSEKLANRSTHAKVMMKRQVYCFLRHCIIMKKSLICFLNVTNDINKAESNTTQHGYQWTVQGWLVRG